MGEGALLGTSQVTPCEFPHFLMVCVSAEPKCREAKGGEGRGGVWQRRREGRGTLINQKVRRENEIIDFQR